MCWTTAGQDGGGEGAAEDYCVQTVTVSCGNGKTSRPSRYAGNKQARAAPFAGKLHPYLLERKKGKTERRRKMRTSMKFGKGKVVLLCLIN
jgi:hypothetical protein